MTRRHFTFTAKLAGAVVLVVLAEILVFGPWRAPAIGIFALVWAGILLSVVARARRGAALVASVVAILLGVVLLDDPSILGWVLFWVALSLAGLLTRHGFDDASRWAQRLTMHGLLGPATPARDAQTLAGLKHGHGASIRSFGRTVALPLIGSALFLALFAGANPLIGDAFASIALPDGWSAFLHIALWITAILCVWPSLRPFPAVLRFGARSTVVRSLPPVSLGTLTLTLSLVCFNAVFALQNGLDLVFLWSGAPLPDATTLADYAHRGAYTLIATALLAGLFVLIALRPESDAARSMLVRRLLVLWTLQNVLLVASSVLRLIDYIAAYSLTILRIAALAWMALVAVGLVLICWRLLAGHSAAWLINANAAAAALVLIAASAVDLGAVAASWNVRHARTEQDLDLCYLRTLGGSALLPLIELGRRAGSDALRDRVAYLRDEAMHDALSRQNGLLRSLRTARRLDAAAAMQRAAAWRSHIVAPRTCNGRLILHDGSPESVAPSSAQSIPLGDRANATLTAEGER